MKKILCLLLFIFIPFVLAIEDFNVYSEQSIETCDCSQYKHEITIYNIGDKADFVIYSESKWITPGKITLNKNEIRQINLPVNIPCTIRGEYNIDLYIKSIITKKIPLTINVKRCPNVEVKIDNNQEACPGKQVKYPIEIKNIGNFKETYYFDVDNYKKYTLIDFKALEIEPGKNAKFNLYFNIPLIFEDNYNLTFITKTKYSKLTASTPLSFTALPCYKYNLDYEDNYTLCQDIEENIPINAENIGEDQTILFDLNLKWTSLDKDKIELEKNKQDTINIKVKPDRTGKYDLILKSKNNIKEKEDLIKIDIKSKRDCYKAEIITEKIISGKGSFKIKNIGFKEVTYALSIDSDWIKIPDTVTLSPGEEKEIDLDIDWKEGRYNFNIRTIADDQEFVQSITLGEFVFHKKIGNFFVNLYNKIKDFIVNNILYVGIVIGIIILLIIILKVVSKISEKRLEKELLKEPEVEEKKVKAEVKAEKKVKPEKKVKKEKPKKEKPKKPRKPIKIPWKLIIPLIIIIIIALLFYFVKTLRSYFLTYWLYILIGILVLFLLIFFMTLISKYGINTKRIKWILTILIIILILLFIYFQYPSIFKFDLLSKINLTTIWEPIKNIFLPIYDFLYVYINYIILGFVVLIILIFFMNLREKKGKKVKEEKEIKNNNKKIKKISKRKRRKRK